MMRWHEIVNENLSFVQMAKSYILDIIAPLKAQGVRSITIQQIVDQLSGNPDLEGTQIDADLVRDALTGLSDLEVGPDPETGQMSVMISGNQGPSQVDKKQDEKNAKSINSAALRAIDKGDSQ